MTQANDYVEYLPVYLAHSHSEEVYCWFTPDAISEAQAMRWDTEKQQPISKDGLNLHTSIQSLDLIWCVTPPSSTPQTMMAVDMDNIMLLLFNTATQPALAQPGTPSVAPNTVPPLAQQSMAEHSNDITMASTVNTHLSALEHSCALLPSILKRLEALAPPQIYTTVQGSTSTLIVTDTPSTQGSALGKRD